MRFTEVYLAVKKYIGAYVAALGGVDVLAFTGGIGEKSANTRSLICNGLEWMGIDLDPTKNKQNDSEALISTDHSQVQILIVLEIFSLWLVS